MSATYLSYCSVWLHIWYTLEQSHYLKHLSGRKKSEQDFSLFRGILDPGPAGEPAPKSGNQRKSTECRKYLPGSSRIPSETYCSRPLVESWDAGDITTAPEGPRLVKPCVWEHSPAKFDDILPNFAGILTILVREALVSPVCIGNV